MRPLPGELAGWWRRVGATAIDWLVVSVPALALLGLIVGLVIAVAGSVEVSGSDAGVLVVVLVAIGTVLAVILAAVVTLVVYAPLTMRRPGRRNGQTWGKQLFGIRAVRMGGEPYDFGAALVREVLVKALLFGAVGSALAYVPTLLDGLWPLWDDERRALHDMIVDSRVIKAAGG